MLLGKFHKVELLQNSNVFYYLFLNHYIFYVFYYGIMHDSNKIVFLIIIILIDYSFEACRLWSSPVQARPAKARPDQPRPDQTSQGQTRLGVAILLCTLHTLVTLQWNKFRFLFAALLSHQGIDRL